MHEVRFQPAEVPHEPSELLALRALLTAQDRHGQRAEFFGAGAGGPAAHGSQKRRRIESAIEPTRGVAKERGFLLQVDIDAAVVDRARGGGFFDCAQGRIERNENDIAALVAQCRGESVVAQATAAEHIAGAGSQIRDSHGAPLGCLWRKERAATRDGPA
ncbi:MAG: hypothetical protein IH986_15910 [Planctomycetes bacterium]|nr:hypothetical protein [Planctomycetota bacterium]